MSLAALLLPVLGLLSPDTAPTVSLDMNGLPPLTVLAPVPERPIPEWVQTNLRRVHLPPADWRQIDAFIQAGYNSIAVNTLEKWDRVGPAASMYSPETVKAADEYLRRLSDTIHKGGARFICYMGPVQVPWLSKEFRKLHPDWLRVNADGTRSDDFVNIMSGYADWLAEQLAYVVREYKVDGFWFDGYAPPQVTTFDDKTREIYRAATGREIPPRYKADDPACREFQRWHYRQFVDLADRLRGAIRKENPDAVLYANYSANRAWYFPDSTGSEYPAAYANAVDVPSVELYWDNPGDALFQQFVYAFTQGVTHDRGAATWVQPQPHGISGVASPVEIRLRNIEGAPWGVYAEYVEPTGREDYLRLHADDIKAREPWWVKSEPVPYIGIVASEQTAAYFAGATLPHYLSHVLGAFRAVFEAHLPVRVLTESDLENGTLGGVRVIVLPNTKVLSDRAGEVVRRFVQKGGGLVATFETGLCDAELNARPNFPLADLFNADYDSTQTVSGREQNLNVTITGEHPVISDPAILAKLDTSWRPKEVGPPVLDLLAGAAKVVPRADAKVVAEWSLPVAGTHKWPAVILSEVGAGRVVYLPAAFDKGYFFYPDEYMRHLIVNACHWAANTPPPLSVGAPLMLATTFRRQPEQHRAVVHLLNDASSYGRHSIYQKIAPLSDELKRRGFQDAPDFRGQWPTREEIIPLHDITVTCRLAGVTKATQQPEGVDLPLKATEGGVEVTVPKMDMYSMVVFE